MRIDQITGSHGAVLDAGGTVLLARCHRADTAVARLIGLLGTRDLRDGEGVWITRCGSVHTMGMRTDIGVAFLDPRGRVLRVVDPMPPWRTARARGAVAAVEARPGVLAHLRTGDVLRYVEADGPGG